MSAKSHQLHIQILQQKFAHRNPRLPSTLPGLLLTTEIRIVLKCSIGERTAGDQPYLQQVPSLMVRRPYVAISVDLSSCSYRQYIFRFFAAFGKQTFSASKPSVDSCLPQRCMWARSPALCSSRPFSKSYWLTAFSRTDDALVLCKHCIARTVSYQKSPHLWTALDWSRGDSVNEI